MKWFMFFLCLKILNAQDQGAILCLGNTCTEYVSENPCPSLPDKCRIQNSTHNGVILPSPDPCNCCPFCLINLNEHDACAVGEIGGLIPDSICGPGLTCIDQECEKMTAMNFEVNPGPPCSKSQFEYDQRRQSGTLGFMEERPNCDDDGFFQPYKCVPGQTCFCLDKEGIRRFGEIPFTSAPNLILHCECSRKYYDILKFFDRESLYPNEHFRCTTTGDYDAIQCIGNNCMCTDAYDGVPTFPYRSGVNISDISNTTLPECFDKNIHLTGKYYYACAERYLAILEEMEAYKKNGYNRVFEVEFPNCDLDGTFAPVQKSNKEENSYYCAKPDGSPIEDYSSLLSDEMNCKCARSILLIPEDAPEKPDCLPNGNFNPVQCRRGTCYCVDENGYQNVANTQTVGINDIDTLSC